MNSIREWTQHILLRSLCSKSRVKINKEIINELQPNWLTSQRYTKAFTIVKEYYSKNNKFISWAALLKSPQLSENISKYIRTKEIKRINLKKSDESLLLPSTASEYRDFFKRVQHDARHIKLIELSNQLSSDLNEEMTEKEVNGLLELLTETSSYCSSLRERKGELFRVTEEEVKKKLKSFYKDLKNHFFLPTGFKDFDDINIGVPLDSLFVIAGETGTGKTALSLTICINAKREFGARVCFVPLEMSIEMMLLRLGSHLLQVPVNEIVKNLKKYYRPLMKSVVDFVTSSNDSESCFEFYIPDIDDTLPDILLRLQNHGYDIICVDYPKLLSSGGMKEHEALDTGAAFAKRWSSKNKCLVMHLNQLDTNSGDIRYSRAIGEHASNMWSMKGNSDFVKENGYITISQPKARNQSPHSFRLQANLACSWFGNYIEDVSDEELRDRKKKQYKKKKPIHKGFDSNSSADIPDD